MTSANSIHDSAQLYQVSCYYYIYFTSFDRGGKFTTPLLNETQNTPLKIGLKLLRFVRHAKVSTLKIF